MHKKIFLLSLPLILSNIALPFLGLVNTSLIGHLHSSDYLAATGLGVSSITFMCFLFSFFRMSVTGMVAQEKARSSQSKELALILIRAVVVACVIILLLLICKGAVLKVFTYIYHMDSHDGLSSVVCMSSYASRTSCVAILLFRTKTEKHGSRATREHVRLQVCHSLITHMTEQEQPFLELFQPS